MADPPLLHSEDERAWGRWMFIEDVHGKATIRADTLIICPSMRVIRSSGRLFPYHRSSSTCP